MGLHPQPTQQRLRPPAMAGLLRAVPRKFADSALHLSKGSKKDEVVFNPLEKEPWLRSFCFSNTSKKICNC